MAITFKMGSLPVKLLLLAYTASAASILPFNEPSYSATLNKVDQTLEPNATGRDVVNAVIHKIQRSGIFMEDDRFLARLAWVESEFGNGNDTTPNTYGIWKSPSTYLDATQSPGTYPNLAELHTKISTAFAINWMTVTLADLSKPLFSGLAVRLYLETVGVSIPASINDQAQYWRQHYNHNPSWSVATYINAVTTLEQSFACNGKLDLFMVLDGSGSMLDYFEATKAFMATLVSRFSLQHIHVGLSLYDGYGGFSSVFPLNNTLTLAQMVQAIQSVPMPEGGSGIERPDLPIRAGIQELRNSGFREGAPQVIATFFDGGVNNGGTDGRELLRAAVSEAKSFDINTFTVPVGDPDRLEAGKAILLIAAGGDPSRILSPPPTLDETSMAQFAYKLNDQICRTTQNRAVNQGDVLLAGETRYYNYNSANLTLFAYMKQGSITVYYSFDTPNPSSAIYEGYFSASTVVTNEVSKNVVIETLSPPPTRADTVTYVAVRGVGAVNSYTLVGVAN